MPTYSYKCTECDTAFDIRQSFSDDALTTCPECRGRLRKVFSPIGVTFVGSGFYRTDSRAANAGKDRGKTEKTSTSGASAESTSGSSATNSSSAAASSAAGTKSGSTKTSPSSD